MGNNAKAKYIKAYDAAENGKRLVAEVQQEEAMAKRVAAERKKWEIDSASQMADVRKEAEANSRTQLETCRAQFENERKQAEATYRAQLEKELVNARIQADATCRAQLDNERRIGDEKRAKQDRALQVIVREREIERSKAYDEQVKMEQEIQRLGKQVIEGRHEVVSLEELLAQSNSDITVKSVRTTLAERAAIETEKTNQRLKSQLCRTVHKNTELLDSQRTLISVLGKRVELQKLKRDTSAQELSDTATWNRLEKIESMEPLHTTRTLDRCRPSSVSMCRPSSVSLCRRPSVENVRALATLHSPY
eukprot:GEMP01033850.1.p1 GENE.GEMP01033850.1~~GEMP01033850.1.p1  ORF type:complete len:307 (+),score=91.59 GEMP01033850.1:135-1055(+)